MSVHKLVPGVKERKRPPVLEAHGPAGSPTVRQRELGVPPRASRTERDLTVDQVATELLCSPTKVSRTETGQHGAPPRAVRDLCEFYGVPDEAPIARLMDLARGGKEQGWWQTYDLEFSTHVGLETERVPGRYLHSTVIPGLRQIAGYARAMHEAIVDESALDRVGGGPATVQAQLARLVELAELPNVIISVIPFAVRTHFAMDSAFRILDFENPVPDVVYVEGPVGFLYPDRVPARHWVANAIAKATASHLRTRSVNSRYD